MLLPLWRNRLNLGTGFDLIACETRLPAVTGIVTNPMPMNIQQGDFKFLRIGSAEEFDHALNISTRASGESTLIPSGTKLEFKRHFKVSSQATFCILRVLGMNAYQRLQVTSFTQEARDLQKNGDKKAFRARFGDGFLSGQLTGIEFFGVIRIEANTIERQLELAAQIQASCELENGVVSTTFKDRLSSAEHQISMAAYQKGGLVSVCDSLSDLVAMANDALDDWYNQKNYPFATEVDPYHAPESPGDTSTFSNIEAARQCIASMTQHSRYLETMLNDIDFVSRNLQWFEKASIPELHLTRRAVCNELTKISEHAKMCATDPDISKNYSPTHLQFEIPSRKHGSKLIGTCRESLKQNKHPEEIKGFFPAMKYISVGNFEIP